MKFLLFYSKNLLKNLIIKFKIEITSGKKKKDYYIQNFIFN